MKKYKDYMILSIIVLFMIFLTAKTSYIFGSDTDWINQHTIFPDYFRQMFYETKKLIPNFAFNYGGGENIFNFSYYGLLNPLILPSYLLPFVDMTSYIITINILTLISSAILFYKFLSNHNIKREINLTSSIIFILSSPLIFHMHRHIMFVNYMPFLIMSLMGVDKYLKNKNKSLLIISVFLMIMTSYYFSVSGLLVIFIYYIYNYLKYNKFKLLDIIKFILILIVPIIMSSILILPTLYTLLSGRTNMQKSITINLFKPRKNISDIINDVDSLGIGIIAIITLIYLYYTKKKENIIIALILTIILFIPICAYILNGGLYTRCKCLIPFIPLFCYLISNYLTDIFNKKINIKKFSILLLISFILLYIYTKDKILLHSIIILLSLIIYNKYNKKLIIILPLIILSFYISYDKIKEESLLTYKEYNTIFNTNIEKEINDIIDSDDDYYRFINLNYNLKTMNKIYNTKYYTTSIYSSTYNKNYLNFVRNNFVTSRNDYNYFLVSSNEDLLFNSFMGVKYIYSKQELPYPYEKVSENVYKNPNALPIIYSTSNTISEKEFNNLTYPYKNYTLLNNVVIEENTKKSNKFNIEQVEIPYKIISSRGVDIEEDVIKVKKEGKIVLKFNEELVNKILFIKVSGLKRNSCKDDKITMTINGIDNSLTCKGWPYPNKNNIFHYTISSNKIDSLEIKLTRGNYYVDSINTYIMDYKDIITQEYDSAIINDIKNDTITATINTKEDGYLVTSIPYDKGFSIKIDGKITQVQIVNTAFIGAKITKGSHNIEIIYNSPYLKEGKILSSIGLIIYIIIIIYDSKKHKKYHSIDIFN